jgi:hypothetical protein
MSQAVESVVHTVGPPLDDEDNPLQAKEAKKIGHNLVRE